MAILLDEMLLGGTSFEATEVEYEYEIYLHLADLEYIGANSPHKVLQEQYGIHVSKSEENATSGSIRARKELFLIDKRVTHELTIKTKLNDGSDLESTVEITGEMYNQYTLLPAQGMRKLRCVMELDGGISLEVDVFETLSGDPVDWVKIDIEMPEGKRLDMDELKNIIPFKYEDIIVVTPESKTNDPELMKRVSELYDKYFTIQNKHISK